MLPTLCTAFECYYQVKVKPNYNLTVLLQPEILRRLRPMRHDYPLNNTAWIKEPVQLFQRGSSTWHEAWDRNLDEYTEAMAHNIAAAWAQGPDGGSGYDDGLLQVDYEPQYRPTWAMEAELVPQVKEVSRVLKEDGRAVFVSMSKVGEGGCMMGCYECCHSCCPSVVDCRPIAELQF